MRNISKARLHIPLTPFRAILNVGKTWGELMQNMDFADKECVRMADGSILTLSDLPSQEVTRWIASRKMTVVRAVAYGLLGRQEALARYKISEEEFQEWVGNLCERGMEGLKVTKRQKNTLNG
jgi:hypothetical protein